MKIQLPDKWILTEVEVVSDLIRGVTYKKKDAKSIKRQDDFLILRGGNIQDGSIDYSGSEIYVDKSLVKNEQKLKDGDVLIVGSTGSKRLIGKAAIIKADIPEVSFGAFLMLIRPLKSINARYFDYYFLSDYYRETIRELAGGININNIRKTYIQKLKIPLAPLKEQQRIVKKLDALFSELDEVKSRLETIPELLKNFRQAVLNQAVTGKLTEEWRKGKVLDEWNETTVGNFMLEVKGKMNPLEEEVSNYIGLEHLRKDGGIIDKSSSKGLKSSKTIFKKGDVLYGKLRPYLNKHDVVDFDGVCSTDILVYRNYFEPSAHFFNYFLGTHDFIQKANSESKGINLPRVSSKVINQFEINIPPNEEQEEILKRVENLFTRIKYIEKKYYSLFKSIENLPQAMLEKAFKGELVEQLPTDGNAIELLEEIKNLKEELKSKKNKRASNKKVKPRNTKNIKKELLKSEIKKLLNNKKEGFNYDSLKSNISSKSNDVLIKEIVEKLMADKIISQYYNKDKEQMMIKINL